MPEALLQNSNCVAAMQQPPRYNGCMSTKPDDEQHTSKHPGLPPGASRRQGRLRCTVAIAAALAGVALLAAACGGGGSTSATAPPASQGGSNSTGNAVAYSQCMRAHGVPNFPDPGPDALPGKPFPAEALAQAGVNSSTPQFSAASAACARLSPVMTPADNRQILSQTLRLVACMRAHGVPSFPDPGTAGGGVQLSLPPSLTSSPPYQPALRACRSVAPAEVATLSGPSAK
jgi:hypothetical protein